MRHARLWSLLLPFVAACGGSPAQPIPIQGSPAEIASLVGEWDGTYESDDGARRGSIDFHLQAPHDTAYGELVMVPQGWGRPLQSHDGRLDQMPDPGIPRALEIRFVRVDRGEVSGEVQRYYDPACECGKITTFRGRLKGNTLRGRYRSYREQGGPPDTGDWRVDRKPATP